MRRFSLLAAASLAPALLSAQAMQATTSTSVVPVPATTLPLKHAAQPTTPAITAADLMTRLYIFADDSMQGREAGTIGNVKGTDYIASEVRKIGLVPAGDNGTYFQTIPLKTRSVSQSSTLSVDGAPLTMGTDWATGNATLNNPSLQVVYGGPAGDSAHMISPADAAGKLVLFTLAPGTSPRLLRALPVFYPGAAAVASIGSEQTMGFMRRPGTFVDDPTAGAKVPPPSITFSPAAAAKLFNAPIEQLTTGTAGKSVAVNVSMNIAPVPYPARNVVGILPGSDPKLKGEYVAIGAHNDHIGIARAVVDHDSLRFYNHIVRPGGAEDGGKTASPEQQAEVNQQLASWRVAHPNSSRPDSISNGADDDGSGSVSVLEIAQKMASLNPKPKRSILFVWHVGEEKGLLGSHYYTDHPTVTRDAIVAQLNIDMVGRGDAYDMTGNSKAGQQLHGGPNYLQLVGSRRLSTELGNLIDSVNVNDKHGFTFDYAMDANGHPQNIYCRSDHYEYARYNIPVTFFTTGGHSDYHQVTDEPQYIDYTHMARVDNLIEDVAVHVANLDHRPLVDGAKMDPHGACRQ